MYNKTNLIITGATVAMLLLPMKTDAQKLQSCLRKNAPESVIQKARKTTPAALQELDDRTKAAYPNLFKGKMLRSNNFSQLKEMPSGAISPLALQPRVPLRAAAYKPGREIWGSVIADNTWTTSTAQYGFYKFYAGSNMNIEALGLNPNITPNGSGALIDGKLYMVNYIPIFGEIIASLYVFDANTWEQEKEVTLNDCSLIATETATAEDGTVYGAFMDADGSSYELGIADYPNSTRSTIGKINHMYAALGITKENEMYGVATDGNLYKINMTTAEETLVGPTGITISDPDDSYFFQSGEIDRKDNTFYWVGVDNISDAKLYTVNLTTGAAEVVGEFTNNNIFVILTLPQMLADNVPAAATDLTASFAGADLNGTVSFKLPTKNIKGEDLTADVSYSISDGGVTTLKTGKGAPGAEITENVTFDADGKKTIIVTTSNDEGNGQTAKIIQYVGFDTPKAVQNTKFDLNLATGDVNLSWNAVTEGENGGYLGDVKYEVVRYPDETVIAKDLTGTSCTDKLTSPTLTSYSYGIKAYNDKKTGAETKTGTKVYGEAFAPPYSETFDTEDAMAFFTIIDNNNDGSTWTYDNNGEVRYKYSNDNPADDWLITPPLKVQKNRTYVVKFKAKSNMSAYPERIEVKYGTTNTVDGMTGVALQPTDLLNEEYVEFSGEMKAAEDGNLYVGFHAISDKFQFYLHLDDISVSAGIASTTPDAVADYTVVPGEKGAHSASLSFTAPTKDISGADLTGNVTLKIKRNDVVIKELTDVAPGSKQTFVDDTPENGFNTYSVTSVNADGEGRSTESVKIFVGYDLPQYPTLTAADNLTSIRVSWTDKDKGVNGGYVDTSTTIHNFFKLVKAPNSYVPSFEIDIPAGIDHYDKPYVTTEGEQDMVQFGVSTVNEVGQSEIGISPAVIIGKPYSMPFFESVTKGNLRNKMWWTDTQDFSISTSRQSSDNDEGCFVMQSGNDDGYAILGTGKISLQGAKNPTFIFCHQAKAKSNAKVTISIQKPDGTVEDVKTIDVTKDDNQWVREFVSLSQEYTSLPYIILRIKTTANLAHKVYMDEFYVRDLYENDLTLNDLTAPEKIKKGETAEVNVTVSNFGKNSVAGYTVNLYAGEKLVDSKEAKAELAPFASATHTLEYTSNVMDEGEAVDLKAEVVYSGDENLDDNTKTLSLAYDISKKPRPTNVTATENGDGTVKVEWTAVPETEMEIEDGFESYTSWATDTFGEWTAVIGESTPEDAKTGSMFTGYPYPSEGQRFAFTLVDPLESWISQAILNANPSLKPHGGSKYLASFYKYSADTPKLVYDADNWLISPPLTGNKQTISFWVSNNNTEENNYTETFDILYSKEGTDISKFVKIGDTRTVSNGAWEQVSEELPEGAIRFAIHQTTKKATNFVMMLDDFTYEGGSGKVIAYKVYRDGTLLKTLDPDQVVFTDDTAVKDKTYSYAVTAVFADGESEATIATITTTDIQSVERLFNASSYDVYTIDGKLIGTGMPSLNTLKPDSYIINNQKVVIR